MLDSHLLQSIFKDSGDLMVILEPTRRVRTANPAFRAIVAEAPEGQDFMDLVAPGARAAVLRRMVEAAGGKQVVVEVQHGSDDLSVRIEYRFFPMDDGRVAGVGRVRENETSAREELGRKDAELRQQRRLLDEIQLELTQVPFIDPVTGVWNRMQVIERLTAEWSRMERYGSPVSCLMVDVENLDQLRRKDPAAADEILKAIARRLKGVVRDHDIVGRFGGDCFVVVAVQSDVDGARALSRRVLESVEKEPIATEHHALAIAVRIGGSTNRSEGVEILEDLFSVAEAALAVARAQQAPVKVAEELHV